MCNILSWVEKDGEIYYLDDATIEAWNEQHHPGLPIAWENYVGHRAIERVLKIRGMERVYETDQGHPLPPVMIAALRAGKFKKLMAGSGDKTFMTVNDAGYPVEITYADGNRWYRCNPSYDGPAKSGLEDSRNGG